MVIYDNVFTEADWSAIYNNAAEVTSLNMLEPAGRGVKITVFVDARCHYFCK